MKKLILLSFIIFCGIHFNYAQKYSPVLSLEECGSAVLMNDQNTMLVVENIADKPNLALYNLNSQKPIRQFKSKLPKTPIAHLLPCDNGLIYFITIKKEPESGKPLFDALYAFNPKKDRIKRIYNEKNDAPLPHTASVVGTKLILRQNALKKQPRFFDVNKENFEPFSNDPDLRLLCTSNTHKGFVVFRKSELRDDDTVPVYVMNTNGEISECIGSYNSLLSISSESDEYILPGLTITNPAYNWTNDAYNQSGMPLSGFSIATRPGIVEKYNKFSNLIEVKEILSANTKYIIANGAKGKLFVYNVESPHSENSIKN